MLTISSSDGSVGYAFSRIAFAAVAALSTPSLAYALIISRTVDGGWSVPESRSLDAVQVSSLGPTIF
jgi:hypothetical protein